jgi:hypothetical protein
MPCLCNTFVFIELSGDFSVFLKHFIALALNVANMANNYLEKQPHPLFKNYAS